VLVAQRDAMLFEQSAKALAPKVHRADGLMDVLAVEKTQDMHHLQLVKRCCQYYAQTAAMGRDRHASTSGAEDPGGGGLPSGEAEDSGRTDVRGFVTRKAAAVRLAPQAIQDRFNVDGEVFDGRSSSCLPPLVSLLWSPSSGLPLVSLLLSPSSTLTNP